MAPKPSAATLLFVAIFVLATASCFYFGARLWMLTGPEDERWEREKNRRLLGIVVSVAIGFASLGAAMLGAPGE